MKLQAPASAFCLVLLAVVAGGCSLVQPPPAPTLFQQMDANHDGKVSREEFNAGFADAVLRVYNLGPAGTINAAQWNAVEHIGRFSTFERLDANHDGKLTRAELSSGKERDVAVNAMFNRIDKDHDGFLSVEEGHPSRLDIVPKETLPGNGR